MEIRDSKGNSARTLHKLKEEKFKEKSELLERERNLDTTHIKTIQDLFWEFHFLRKPSSGGCIEPFDPQRIKSHLELLNKSITTWEYKLILDMDLVFRSKAIDKRGT